MGLGDVLNRAVSPNQWLGGGNTVEMQEGWAEYAAFPDEGSLEMAVAGES